jgi:hypothetical protein
VEGDALCRSHPLRSCCCHSPLLIYPPYLHHYYASIFFFRSVALTRYGSLSATLLSCFRLCLPSPLLASALCPLSFLPPLRSHLLFPVFLHLSHSYQFIDFLCASPPLSFPPLLTLPLFLPPLFLRASHFSASPTLNCTYVQASTSCADPARAASTSSSNSHTRTHTWKHVQHRYVYTHNHVRMHMACTHIHTYTHTHTHTHTHFHKRVAERSALVCVMCWCVRSCHVSSCFRHSKTR